MAADAPTTTRNALIDLVARIPRAELAEEILRSMRKRIGGYRHLPPELAEGEVLVTCHHALRLWTKWLVAGELGPAADLAELRESVGRRALDGIPLEDLTESYRLGGRLGWQAMRRHATPGDHDLLLDAAELLMEFLDQLTAEVVETYLNARHSAASEEERHVRDLLQRVESAAAPTAADRALAHRLGVVVPDPAVPFAICLPGGSAEDHARLARDLRATLRSPVVTQGQRVFGLAERAPAQAEVDRWPGALLALGEPTAPPDLAAAREEIELLVDHGRATGCSGALEVRDRLPELLLARSPRLVEALRDRYLDPLGTGQSAELRRTLDVLLRCDMDRGRTCAELHVHRNTLAYRLTRIERLLGIDLSSPRDLACVVLALAADHP